MRLWSHPSSLRSATILLTVSETFRLGLSWYPSPVSMISVLAVLPKTKISCLTKSLSWIFSSKLPRLRAIFAWSAELPLPRGCAKGLKEREEMLLIAVVLVSVVILSSLLRVSLKILATPALMNMYCLLAGSAKIVLAAFSRLLVYGRQLNWLGSDGRRLGRRWLPSDRRAVRP